MGKRSAGSLVQTSVWLSEEQYKALSAIAAEEGISRQAMLTRIVKHELGVDDAVKGSKSATRDASLVADYVQRMSAAGYGLHIAAEELGVTRGQITQWHLASLAGHAVTLTDDIRDRASELLGALQRLPTQAQVPALIERVVQRVGPPSGGSMARVADVLRVTPQRLSKWRSDTDAPKTYRLETLLRLLQLQREGVI
jgi:hypothetical protein